MRPITLTLAAAAAAVAAESFSAFLLDFDEQPLVAKSIGGDGDATTYVLGCKADIGSEDCGYPYPMVYVAGPKTARFTIERPFMSEEEGDFSYEQFIDCSLAGTTVATCTATMKGAILTNTNAQAGDGRAMPTSVVQAMFGTDVADYFQTVEIVKETASIMNYGTDAHGKPTKYDGAAKAVETAAASGAEETGMVTSKAALPSQTGTMAQSDIPSILSKVSSSASDAAASATSSGFAAEVTGLGAFAVAAIAGVMGVAAL